MSFGHHFQIFTLEDLALPFIFYLINMHLLVVDSVNENNELNAKMFVKNKRQFD